MYPSDPALAEVMTKWDLDIDRSCWVNTDKNGCKVVFISCKCEADGSTPGRNSDIKDLQSLGGNSIWTEESLDS